MNMLPDNYMNADIIPILMPGMNLSDQNTLQLVLSRRLGANVQKGFPETVRPQLIIANLDNRKTLEHISRYQADYPGVPIIGLSFQPRSLEGVKVLPRPFKMDILVDSVKQQLEKPSRSVKPVSGEIKPKIRVVRADTKRAKSLSACLSVNADNTFIEMLHGAYIESITGQKNIGIVQKSANEQPEEFIFTAAGHVICNHKRAVLRSICSLYKDRHGFQKRLLSNAEIRDCAAEKTGFLYDGETFFWEVISGCFRNKLPEGLSSDALLVMERWPNCIGLRYPMQAVTMASVCHQGPVSIEDIVSRTGFPRNRVVEFIAAAYSLGFMKKVSVAARQDNADTRRHGKPASTINSLVRRLARKLFGSK